MIPAVREVIELKVESSDSPPTGDNIFQNPADAVKWARERGLERFVDTNTIDTNRVISPPVTRGPIFHNPCYTDGSEGSFMVNAKTREFIHEPVGPPPSHTPIGATYEIRPCGDKGNGMFAVRNLAPGETILAEHPALLQPHRLSMSATKEELYRTMYSRLEPDALERLRTLKNCKPEDVCGWEEGVIRTNGIGVHLTHPDEIERLHSAVFIDISRCNHSCGPNATYTWHLPSYSERLYATRHIKAGEEITITYVEDTIPRAERRRNLRNMYYFDCACVYCDLPDGEAIRCSDERRALLHKWSPFSNGGLQVWFSTPSMPATVVLAPYLRAEECVEAEGLHAIAARRDIVDAVAGIYGMNGNEDMFRLWCKKAIDVWAVLASDETMPEAKKKVRMYEKWLAKPSAFKAWNKRPETSS